MKNIESFAEKCKAKGRKVFSKIGHVAVGNDSRGKTDVVPFSFNAVFSYEKQMPRRKK